VLSGNGFHIPTYVAIDRGFYNDEGLDAHFISLTGRALVTAALISIAHAPKAINAGMKILVRTGDYINDKDADIVWDRTYNAFSAELPKDLFHEIFDSRRIVMIAAKQWPADKPVPNPERYLLRSVLDSTLKQMDYVPTKLDALTR